MRTIAHTLSEIWLVGVLFASLTAAVLSQKVSAQPPPTFPAGFEKLASEILISPDSQHSAEIRGPFDRSFDCGNFYRASELWIKETDPSKKLYAKICLQAHLHEFYESGAGAKHFFNFPIIDRKQFYRRMMDVLAGGELDKAEILAKAKEKRVVLKTIPILSQELENEPSVFRRDNEGNVTFEFGKGGNSFSLPIAITPLTPDTFQVIACNRRTDEASGLDKFYGLLFSQDGRLLTSQEDGKAVAGCFGKDGEILLLSDSVISEEEEKYCVAKIQIRSADGKMIKCESLKLPVSGYPRTIWSVSPNTNQLAWTVEAWSDYRYGWGEDGYHRWEAGWSPTNNFKKVEEHDDWTDLREVAHKIAPVDNAFRYTRSTYFHSIDALGRQGFEISCVRYAHSPLELTNYERRLNPSVTEDNSSVDDRWTKSLCLPRTDSNSPLRNSWPNSKNFFVGSDCYEPVFWVFLRARQGIECNVEAIANSYGDGAEVFGESATFFYDPSGNLKGWSMGYVAGDAEDGESLLVTRTSGQLLTISPEYKVTAVRTFVTPDGKEAKPLLMLESHHAGIFLVGKSIVVGTWKPPLLQRLFSRSGKNKSANAGN